jgi:pimeloyl-ACP methyl ester carboxylesterase
MMPYVTVGDQRVFYQGHLDDIVHHHPPLLLVHGAGGNHLYWPPQLRHLSACDVFAFDLPGHGRSEGQGRARIEDYRETIFAAVETLRLRPFVFCGHSMGGAVGLDFALTYPERLVGLILVSAGARLRVAREILDGILNDFTGTLRLIADWAYGSAPSERMRQLYIERMRETLPQVILDDFRACDAFDVMGRVDQIQLPTLLICGGNDRLTPPKFSHYLRDHLPNAQLVEFPQAGHMVMLEHPDEVTMAINEFVQTLSVGVASWRAA